MRKPKWQRTMRTRRAATAETVLAEPAGEGADEPETGPLRRCAVTREQLPKERMIRFVIGPAGQVVPDLAARLPGRGIWLSARGDVIETARTRGVFAKAARAQVTVPLDLLTGLQAALVRRIGEHLGLARRAGQAIAGYSKAREWLEKGRVALVVQAADGSPEERSRFLGSRKLPVVAPLDGSALGTIFGSDHTVHVAVAAGQLAERIRIEAERLAGLMVPLAEGEGGGRGSPRRGRTGGAASGKAGSEECKVQADR